MIQKAYDTLVRPFLPRKIGSFNGVPVRRPKLFDQTDVRPGWEATFIDAVQTVVQPGDAVVELGGGLGVSAVYAARATGEQGTVHVFDPSEEAVSYIEETADLSRVADRVSVTNAGVGEVKESFLDDVVSESKNIDPTELPDCDVLLMDCEGAELDIVKSMTIRPRHIVIETHPYLGAPTDDVVESLPSEYDVRSVVELDEESPLEYDEDIRIVTAERKDQ